MRRVGNLWPLVTSYANLERAALRASLGKRHTRVVARFLERLEPNVIALQHELESETYRPGEPHCFEIFDPKQRTISAAPFRDRVVHHALIDVCEPWFDRRMVFESFACRRGKGSHVALAHARRMVCRWEWFLKLDIAKCFDSLSHDVVLDAVQRVVKDRRVLGLFEAIVRHGNRSDGSGLPIGNLTSQWLANLTLDRLDHHVKERLRVPGYVRYMDDFVLFACAKEPLSAWHDAVDQFVRDRLALELKTRVTMLAPTSNGLPFLGWSLHRGVVRLRRANLRRSEGRLRRRTWEYERGRVGERAFLDAVRSITAHLSHGNTTALRRAWFETRSPLMAVEP